jgi:hypothetical protein
MLYCSLFNRPDLSSSASITFALAIAQTSPESIIAQIVQGTALVSMACSLLSLGVSFALLKRHAGQVEFSATEVVSTSLSDIRFDLKSLFTGRISGIGQSSKIRASPSLYCLRDTLGSVGLGFPNTGCLRNNGSVSHPVIVG